MSFSFDPGVVEVLGAEARDVLESKKWTDDCVFRMVFRDRVVVALRVVAGRYLVCRRFIKTVCACKTQNDHTKLTLSQKDCDLRRRLGIPTFAKKLNTFVMSCRVQC